MSRVEVDKIQQQCGTTLTVGGGACKTAVVDATTVTIGRCGGTVSLAAGATQSGFGRTGTVDWVTTVQTGTITVVDGKGYFVNTTSGEITANLPVGAAGSICSFKDYANTFDNNNLKISPNGSEKIDGVAGDAYLNTEDQSVTLVYIDSTQGWKTVQDSTSNVEGSNYITASGGNQPTASGCIVCTDYKIHTFTGPGTFCVSAGAGPLAAIDYLVVAGGGGGGGRTSAGGGGAGGFRLANSTSMPAPLTSPLATPTALPVSVQGYPITVGGGGAGAPGPANPATGTSGVNSVLSTIASAGGGGGKCWPNPGTSDGVDGGSGGGGGGAPGCGGSGNTPSVSPPQGYDGGGGGGGGCGGGGGGGAGAVGVTAPPSPSSGGAGGVGGYVVQTGFGGCYGTTGPVPNTRYFAGGGGGRSGSGNEPGGSGGGGTGASNNSGMTAGGCNTGGGGGGSGGAGAGAQGGSGIVIIRYKFQ